MNYNFKEIGKYESEEGNVKVLLDEKNEMLCNVNIEELTKIVGFKQKRTLEKLIERNPRIKTEKFSRIELMNTNGGIQETRLFTERGIVEVAFLAGTKKAEKFRDDIYDLLVSLREKNMVSFGANGLDVKLLEQVKKSNDEVIEVIEDFIEKDEESDNLEEKLDIVIAAIEQFEKDREAIKYIGFFQSRLEEAELEIMSLKKMVDKIINK